MNAYTKSFSISINPTYKCSNNCEFCYLGDKKNDPELLSLSKIHDKLSKIYSIDTLDIYGGEIAELTEDYLYGLLDCVHRHNPKVINIITSLSRIISPFNLSSIQLYISWDYIARPNHKLVLSNLKQLKRPYSILTLATHKLAKESILEEYIAILNNLEGLISVEIKPYSMNQYNDDCGSEESFEKIVKYLLQSSNRKFNLVNKDLLDIALKGKRPLLNNHVFINPVGNFCLLDFDKDGKEYFKEIDNLEEIKNKETEDIIRMYSNPVCRDCKYTYACLSEHISYNTCTGHKDLLEWYEGMDL